MKCKMRIFKYLRKFAFNPDDYSFNNQDAAEQGT